MQMRNKKLFTALAISIALIGWLAFNYIEKERQRAIVHEVWPLFSDCSSDQNSKDITFTGKALIWEGKSDQRSAAYDKLPSSLKANSLSDKITIFMITSKQPKIIGTYELTGQKAVQVRAFICIVSWPEKKVIGGTSIMGEPPPEEKDVNSGAKNGVGDIDTPIANWIASLTKNK
jgi:hypothetical protein